MVSTAQFEPRDFDKEYNLSRIRALAENAKTQGACLVVFPECCLTGYSFVQSLPKADLLNLAEPIPGGKTVLALQAIATEVGIAIGAGLFETNEADDANAYVYNTYLVVDAFGLLVAKQRKLQPFVSPHLTAGDSYCVFELFGARFGILICYDNNLPENVRCTALLGAEILLMPHVTGGTESDQPGRGERSAASSPPQPPHPAPPIPPARP